MCIVLNELEILKKKPQKGKHLHHKQNLILHYFQMQVKYKFSTVQEIF